MNNRPYQMCVRCVMDTSDHRISFDAQGVCNHCNNYEARYNQIIPLPSKRQAQLDHMISQLKKEGKHKKYDAIIGLSGGIDSSYLVYWATRIAKLRLLAVHVDAGWNSPIAVDNIKKLVRKLGVDLYTHTFDWNIMRDLQVAFLKSGVANQDTPQDHAFFAALYNFAVKNNIRNILSGYNFVSESVLPMAWGHSAMDLDQIKDIHKKFGVEDFRKFPQISFWKNYIYYPMIKKMKVLSPLNYIQYNPLDAIKILEQKFSWVYYGGKHYESQFTKFFQSYWLPERFGFDKRKAHLSSLILGGIISRNDALKELEAPPYEVQLIENQKTLVATKLGLSKKELEKLMRIPIKKYSDYANNTRKIMMLSWARYLCSLPRGLYQKTLRLLSK